VKSDGGLRKKKNAHREGKKVAQPSLKASREGKTRHKKKKNRLGRDAKNVTHTALDRRGNIRPSRGRK